MDAMSDPKLMGINVAENEPKPTTEVDKPATSDQGAAEADRFFQFIRRRTQDLQAAGMPEGRARGTAMLEHRIAQWPPEWGDELRIIIYGDFRSPETDLQFADLGIVVEAGAVKESIARSAMCVLKARVTISEKTIAGLVDAGARINTLLGVLVAVDWGNAGSGWWCHVTHGSMAGLMLAFDQEAIAKAVTAVKNLQPDVRRKVTSALHWIREPRQMMMEGYRSDVLRVYAGYWNAFECLVEAVCILRPQPKLSRKEKQDRIDQFVADHDGKLDPASIGECYRSYVDPGFVAKASHALTQCFAERADGYISECFRTKPEQDRLYSIRNAINHGDIEAENLQELIRVEDKHQRLWMIVFGMLGQIIPVPRPLDV
jgi:ribosomal protein S9